MSNGPVTLSPNPLALKLRYLNVNKYYALGYSVMLLYDHILTFASEVELVWRRRFTLPTYLFLIFRYVTPVVCIITLVAEHDPTWTGSRCARWAWLPVSIGTLISATTGVLRTHALYNRASWILYITVPIYLGQLAIWIWSIPVGAPAQLPPLPPFIGCIPSEMPNTDNRLLASYIASVVFDAAIFLATFACAVYLRLQSARIPLVALIMRDGTVYFFVLLIANLINVFLLRIGRPDLSNPNARFSNLITATLVSRLMLNLRAVTRPQPARARYASAGSRSGASLTTCADVKWGGEGEEETSVSEGREEERDEEAMWREGRGKDGSERGRGGDEGYETDHIGAGAGSETTRVGRAAAEAEVCDRDWGVEMEVLERGAVEPWDETAVEDGR